MRSESQQLTISSITTHNKDCIGETTATVTYRRIAKPNIETNGKRTMVSSKIKYLMLWYKSEVDKFSFTRSSTDIFIRSTSIMFNKKKTINNM